MKYDYWTPGPSWRETMTKTHNWYSSRSILTKFMMWTTIVSFFAGAFGGGLIGVGNAEGNIGVIIEEGARNMTGVSLVGHVYNIDIPSRSVQISWLIVGCGALHQKGTQSYGIDGCGRLSVPATFFADGSSEPNGSYDPSAAPHTGEDQDSSLLYVQALNEFQTTHILEIASWNGLDQQYAYPFDTYFLDASFIAINTNTNDSIPILSLSPVDSTNNFAPYIQQDAPTFVYDPQNNVTLGRYMRMQFRRTVLTQIFVVTLFVVNWALTGVVLFITISANDGKEVNESILVLPLSVIVTIPSLRALWVGAPTFGLLLDSCGLFLQMVVVSLCSIILVVNVGLSSKTDWEIRRRRHRRYSEFDNASLSDMEWKDTHGLKRAPVLAVAQDAV